jgi:hypothetical protein
LWDIQSGTTPTTRVLSNADTVREESSFEEAGKLYREIEYVWVNGDFVWSHGAATGAHPGLVLQR